MPVAEIKSRVYKTLEKTVKRYAYSVPMQWQTLETNWLTKDNWHKYYCKSLKIPLLFRNGKCENTLGSFKCLCDDGYSVKARQFCIKTTNYQMRIENSWVLVSFSSEPRQSLKFQNDFLKVTFPGFICTWYSSNCKTLAYVLLTDVGVLCKDPHAP